MDLEAFFFGVSFALFVNLREKNGRLRRLKWGDREGIQQERTNKREREERDRERDEMNEKEVESFEEFDECLLQ